MLGMTFPSVERVGLEVRVLTGDVKWGFYHRIQILHHFCSFRWFLSKEISTEDELYMCSVSCSIVPQ